MIEKIFKLFSDDYYSDDSYYDNERFYLKNYGIIIDKRYGKAYFELNPLKYKMVGNHVVDKSTGKSAFRKIEYTRYELTDENKILDKVTNKEYDDLEDIVLLLNAQNHFIDRTKDALDDEMPISSMLSAETEPIPTINMIKINKNIFLSKLILIPPSILKK